MCCGVVRCKTVGCFHTYLHDEVSVTPFADVFHVGKELDLLLGRDLSQAIQPCLLLLGHLFSSSTKKKSREMRATTPMTTPTVPDFHEREK